MKAGRKAEVRAAKTLGMDLTLGSGSIWFSKSDAANRDFRLEVKSTEKKSFSLTRAIWNKLRQEATATGKMPLAVVEIQGESLTVSETETFAYYYETANGLEDVIVKLLKRYEIAGQELPELADIQAVMGEAFINRVRSMK